MPLNINMPNMGGDAGDAFNSGLQTGADAYKNRKPSQPSTPIANTLQQPAIGASAAPQAGYQPGMLGANTGQDPTQQQGAMQRRYSIMGGGQ